MTVEGTTEPHRNCANLRAALSDSHRISAMPNMPDQLPILHGLQSAAADAIRDLELLRAQVELFRGFIGRMEWGQVSLPNRAARTVLNLADDWETGRLPIGDRGLGAPPRPPDGPPQQLMRRGGQ